LPDSLSSGRYYIRAYSRWMRNKDVSLFATKSLDVINPFVKNSMPKGDSYHLRDTVFCFVEGGKLVPNISNKVILYACDKKGNPIRLRGSIQDNKSNVLHEFETRETGYDIVNFIPNQFNKYLLSYGDEKVDTLASISDSLVFLNYLTTNNKTYVYANTSIADENGRTKFKIYSTLDSFKTIKLEYQRNTNVDRILIDSENKFYFFAGSNIFIYNNNFVLLDEIQTEYSGIYPKKWNNDFMNSYYFGGVEYYDTINSIPIKRYKKELFYFNDDSIAIKFDGDYETYDYSLDNSGYSVLFRSHGFYTSLYIPIEEDKKAYYLSIEKPRPPSFWTYPPFPNPANDRIKMKFYSGMMQNIENLKVELVEISSGRVYTIKDYNISITDDYFGEIEIKLGQFNRGAYLINYKLGEANKSEPLIIK